MVDRTVLIRLEDVSFHYPGGARVLDNLNFQLREGDRVGLIGPNGSGKTTLFHLIMGLLRPSSGTIEIFGRTVRDEREFKEIRPRIGLLFQDADDQLFSPTVLEDVAFGPLNLGKSQKEAIDISLKTLDLFGMMGFENRITHKLSGGEKRLVSLATVLAMEPQILLLDEPTAGLDETTRAKLIEILKNIDLSYILISHEVDFLSETTDCTYGMENGRVLTEDEMCLHPHYHGHIHGRFPHEHNEPS